MIPSSWDHWGESGIVTATELAVSTWHVQFRHVNETDWGPKEFHATTVQYLEHPPVVQLVTERWLGDLSPVITAVFPLDAVLFLERVADS